MDKTIVPLGELNDPISTHRLCRRGFRYAPRRVNCPWDGVQTEWIPWDNGKERMTTRYKVFLARWAQRLSWKETAQLFETSWSCILRAVQFVVNYGLAHRSLEGVPPPRSEWTRSPYSGGTSTLPWSISWMPAVGAFSGAGQSERSRLCSNSFRCSEKNARPHFDSCAATCGILI